MTHVLYPYGLVMYFSRVPASAGFEPMALRDHTGFDDDMREELRSIMAPLAHDAIIVFQGGEDVNPRMYGEDNLYSGFSVYRDAWEKLCWEVSQELGIPFIGICRGHQLVAALNGGALYQDLYRQLGARHSNGHSISFTDTARDEGFFDLMQSNPTGSPYLVNSLHHQAVKRVPECARVLATASDNTPEALLYPNGVTAQWHPEFLDHWQFLTYVRDRFLGDNRDRLKNQDGGGNRVREYNALGDQAYAVAGIHDSR